MSDPLGAFLQGLVGDDETPGFQGGYGFRRKIIQGREDRDYERARRLREGVGFQLQQRVREGELAQQGRQAAQYDRTTSLDTAHRQRIANAAAQIRQQYGADPKYKGLTLLPDEELVAQFGDILTHPERIERPYGFGSRGGAGGADERAVIGLANRLYDPEGVGESSGSFQSWEEAYTEALKRYHIAGRLGGHTPPPAGAGAQPHQPFEVPSTLRNYLRNRGPGPMRTVLPPGPQTPSPDPGFSAPRVGQQQNTDPGFTAPRVGNAPDTDPGFTAPPMNASGQQREWDTAAAFIKAHPEKYRGKRPEDVLGPRP